jgi:hypothetical protein
MWIVIVILIAVLVGSNLLMFAVVRGMRSGKGELFTPLTDLTRPWKKEDEGLRELSQRVKDLKSTTTDEDE